MEKDKTRTQYIEDIYDLAKMEFSQQSIDKASEIIDYLRDPLVEWEIRPLTYVLCFSMGFCAAFLLSMAIVAAQ